MRRVMLPALILPLATAAMAQAQPGLSPMARLLEKQIRSESSGFLVVLDGPKGDWKAKVDALYTDPDWVDLGLSLDYYGQKAAEIEPWLQGKAPVPARPVWVLFGEKGRVVASGDKAPEAGALLKAATDAGIRSEVQLLRAFWRANPDHLEARQRLFRRLQLKAARKTLLKLGKKPDPIWPADVRRDEATLTKRWEAQAEAREQEERSKKPVPELEEEEDRAIWGEASDQLLGIVRSGDWLLMDAYALVLPEEAKHSPGMKEACRQALPEVENALARRPESWAYWQVWLAMARVLGGRPIRPLLDGLVPLPTTAPENWPPWAVRVAYVKDARSRRDWTAIKELLLPAWESSQLWESIQGHSTWVEKVDGKEQGPVESGSEWRATIAPLVEALLNLGETHAADGIVRAHFTLHPWDGLPSHARDLATQCNQPGLAVQWGGLVPAR